MMSIALVACSSQSENRYRAEYQQLGQFEETRLDELEQIVQCVNENGFPDVFVNNAGVVQANDIPDEQLESLYVVQDTCLAEICETCGQGFSEQTLTRLYYLEIEAKACLEDEGITVSDPPSLQVYLDSHSTGAMPWTPHGEAARAITATEDPIGLVERCPDPGNTIRHWST